MEIREEDIIEKIYLIRGRKVMIDRELAPLYKVETKVLKQSVRRNISRFPEDFMFEMSIEEFEDWRSQYVTSNSKDRMGLRYPPFCFTEQGVTMLSCILNSEQAIRINIQIIRIFIKLREMILNNKDILLKLEQLENKVAKNDENMRMVFIHLKKLLDPPITPRQRIGFKP